MRRWAGRRTPRRPGAPRLPRRHRTRRRRRRRARHRGHAWTRALTGLRKSSGGFGLEQVPAAVEPARQQPLFFPQLRHLSRILVNIRVQVIEAVAGERIDAKDLLERYRPLVLTPELRHLFLDAIQLASHVGSNVAHRLHIDLLRLFDDHRRTPTVKSGALRSGNRAASAGEIATLFE